MIAWEDESGSSPGQIVALIGAMSAEERSKPEILDVSRRRRIAAGAGVRPDEVDLFLEQFARVRILMGKIAKMSLWQKIKMITGYESTPE